MDKVWDEYYYILTLAALVKELRGRRLCKNKNCFGVPVAIWYNLK